MDLSPDESLSRLAERKPWNTLSGTLLRRENEDLLDYGRLWARRKTLHLSGPASILAPQSFDERQAQFWAVSEPRRLRVRDVTPPGSSSPSFSGLLIDGGTWWASEGEHWITNAGDERYGPGYTDLLTMIFPPKLLDVFSVRSAKEVQAQVGGRPALEFRATPLEALVSEGPELVVLGSDDYFLEVDLPTGIILRWTALLAGQPARECKLSNLRFDPEVDPEVFVPPLAEDAIAPPQWPGGDPLAR